VRLESFKSIKISETRTGNEATTFRLMGPCLKRITYLYVPTFISRNIEVILGSTYKEIRGKYYMYHTVP
jgi:hypothetical protein